METYLGMVNLFAFNYAPKFWLLCDGTLLNINQNQPLYALLGTTYGGDGKTNFALPNLVGKSPVPGLNYYICYEGVWPPRKDD